MGKLFRGRNRYSDEEFENEEFDDDEMLEDDEEFDDDEILEDEIEEDEEFDGDSEDEDDETYDVDETDSEDEDPDEEEDDGGDDSVDERFDDGGKSRGRKVNVGADYSEEEEDEEDDADEEDDDNEDDEDEEWEEDDRREYRRKRRIRNQVVAYSVVFVILAGIVTGGVFAGRNVARVVKAKKLAEEQAEMEARIQAEQEAEEAHDIVIAAPETIDEESEEDFLGQAIVDGYISEMTLEDKVAGLFIVTPEALTGVNTATKAGEGTQEALNEYKVGGLIYFDKNIVDREQITEMLSGTAAKSIYPIFLAVDEEGGSVSRVAESDIDVIKVGDMAAIGESGDTAQAYEAGLTIGNYLKELGFNLDFAPVADVAGSGDSAMGDRVFGSDAQLVGDMVTNVVQGIEGTGVSSCLKHFPGIGDAAEDTHKGRVETTKTLEEMRNSDFIPFIAGIEAGADFVMVSHITASEVDEDALPSTLSKKIMTDILRDELGFRGVIITDALNMSAITEYYTPEDAAVMAIEAGADMLLMPEDFNAAYDALLAAVQDGTISEERINESLERIYRVKCAGKLE